MDFLFCFLSFFSFIFFLFIIISIGSSITLIIMSSSLARLLNIFLAFNFFIFVLLLFVFFYLSNVAASSLGSTYDFLPLDCLGVVETALLDVSVDASVEVRPHVAEE